MWSEFTKTAFEPVPLETTQESCLYVWKRALHLLFDPTKGFEISPAHPERAIPQANVLERSVYYIVRNDGCPVFFIEINPFAHLKSISTRAMADEHMRQRFADLKEDLKIGRLYGISCIGPQFGVWSMDSHTGEVSPHPVQRSTTHIIDTAPHTWWTHHVLETSGHQRLESVARNIHDMVVTATMPRDPYPHRRNNLSGVPAEEPHLSRPQPLEQFVLVRDDIMRSPAIDLVISEQTIHHLPRPALWAGLFKKDFELLPLETTQESCLYAWKRALHLLFDPTKGYEISSAHLAQAIPQANGLNRSVYYIVRTDGFPIFFIEINSFTHLNSISTRAIADEHMRQRFADLKEDLKIGCLYGISCMGPQFGVWSMDSRTGEVSPHPVQRSTTHIIDSAPRTWWTHHVLETSGHQRLESVARNVYNMVVTATMPRDPYPHHRNDLRSAPAVDETHVNRLQLREQPVHDCVDIINVPGPQERPRTPVMPESPMTRVSSALSSRAYPLDPTFTYLDSEVIYRI